MQDDRRQIQTAVLGSADSEKPLMLPLEAIELDAFRCRFEHDTFWCGLLLGGCGGQLTTKLYTDRVCHFAHHPDPDGLPHVCRRRSRGVASADHLYVKAAAATWLHGRGEQARFDFAQPDGVPVGSVVDIHWRRGGLRVHLDQAVAPVWDEGSEPVLGVSVPVDRDTLIRRWYIHRIRLDSEGTARRVRIGTEAFARPTEWFGLDECAMTERGLSTPAVERIIKARTTAPSPRWPAGKAKKEPDVEARAQVLLRQLASARKVESVVVVNRVSREIADLTGASSATQTELANAVRDARQWLLGQADVRRELFARLDEAVTTRNAQLARELLARANATAAHDRTEDEDRIAGAAADFVVAQTRVQEAANAERAMERAEEELAELTARAAFETVRRVLRDLRHRPRRHMSKATLYSQVQLLVEEAAKAGKYVTASQHQEIDRWVKRAERAQAGAPAPTAPARTVGKDPVSSKPRANASTGTAEQSNTITVWVWKDRYGGLHAADTPRPEASVRHVPLPTEAGPLQRLYGNLTRMIAEREAVGGPVQTGRASLFVRIWEKHSGELAVTLTRRKGCTAVTLALPAELGPLRELHDKVVAQMKAHNVARQPRTKRKNG
ncbi:zinc finger domain-containing protein [Streptomyces sp. NEAU-174]|uniref:zinc finger domain-containing protein n=1 Tax=Streptomyces sp. NEAU-174 TaxID=3458254 RepID=UPI004044D1C3